MSTLVIAEHIRGAIRDVTLELVSAAGALGAPVTVAIIARDLDSIASDVNVAGVDEIVMARVDQDEFENDLYQQAIEAHHHRRQPR